MDESAQVRKALTALADRGVGGVQAPPLDALRRRHRAPRLPVLAVAAAVAVVLAVVVPFAVYQGSPPTPSAHQGSPAAWPSPVTYPASGPGTVAALRHDHWSMLPPAPIAAREDAVGVWTGARMIVWGGWEGNRTYADGAAYNPTTKTWTKLPAAPISGRAGADYVWTGKLLFIWGNYGNRTDSVANGAVYNPATRRWITLPPPPFPGLGPSAAVWTGSTVVLLTSPRQKPSSNGAEVVYAQSYDSARNAWTRLPKLSLSPRHGLGELSAVAVGGHVFTWAMWSHTVTTSKDDHEISSSTTSGVDAYQLDTGTQQWSRSTLVPGKNSGVLRPLWTGREILVPTLSFWCGGCSPPANIHSSGARMDPRSSTLQTLRPGPVSDLNASYVWTGAALLGAGADAQMGSEKPGDTAAWDPRTNAWTSLPSAPLAGQDPIAVWTGTSLLVWGSLHTTGRSTPSASTGLRFGS
jgi:hypothetical protein